MPQNVRQSWLHDADVVLNGNDKVGVESQLGPLGPLEEPGRCSVTERRQMLVVQECEQVRVWPLFGPHRYLRLPSLAVAAPGRGRPPLTGRVHLGLGWPVGTRVGQSPAQPLRDSAVAGLAAPILP